MPCDSSFARSRATVSTSASPAAKASPSALQHWSAWSGGQGARRTSGASSERARTSASGSRRLREAHSPRDGARPGLAQRRVPVGDELLRVVEPRAHRAARAPLGPLVPAARRARHHSRDDERAEARPEAVLVDADADGGFQGARRCHTPRHTAPAAAGQRAAPAASLGQCRVRLSSWRPQLAARNVVTAGFRVLNVFGPPRAETIGISRST